MLVLLLQSLALISVVGGIVTAVRMPDPMNVLSVWDRLTLTIPGFVAGVQFFAMAAILHHVTEIRNVVDPPEPTPRDRMRKPIEQIQLPPDVEF